MRKTALRFCNCAQCGRELVGESCRGAWASMSERQRKAMPIVRGRIHGRPYCDECLEESQPPAHAATRDETSPWQENAVRALEGRDGE